MDSVAFWLAILAVVISLGVVFLGLRLQQQKQKAKAAAEAEAAARAAAEPAPVTPSPFASAEGHARDDLRHIKGIGPKLEIILHGLGVYSFAQIASWSPDQLALVDAKLGTFAGRPERDQWQSQARLLAAGDIKAYERVHGKLGGAAPAAPGTPLFPDDSSTSDGSTVTPSTGTPSTGTPSTGTPPKDPKDNGPAA